MLTQNTYTIPEMARMINKTSNTCYRYVREKKLNVITVKQHGKNIVTVTDEELKRFCKENDIIIKQHGNNVITENNNVITENIQNIVKSTIDNVMFQLTKPVEEQAIFKLGQASQEIVNLRAEKEILLDKIDELQEQIKQLKEEKENIIKQAKEEIEKILNRSLWQKILNR